MRPSGKDSEPCANTGFDSGPGKHADNIRSMQGSATWRVLVVMVLPDLQLPGGESHENFAYPLQAIMPGVAAACTNMRDRQRCMHGDAIAAGIISNIRRRDAVYRKYCMRAGAYCREWHVRNKCCGP
jgi:hypothetical protein